tara:strand:+ start:31 stop:291 length:261 start_codon:yes stop_codon:yes gene_type:complete
MQIHELRTEIYNSNFSIDDYNGLIELIHDTMTLNAKSKINVGDEVWVVQKTKRSKGVVTKVAIKKAVVDIENEGSYRVPFSMLERR